MLHITINDWSFDKKVQVKPGLKESTYRNTAGWTAREIHRGPKNAYVGLLVLDERGTPQGIVRHVGELP